MAERIDVRSHEEPPPPADEGDIVDFARLRELAGFALRSPRRHASLALSIFALTAGTSVLAAIELPRTYQVDSKILAQRNLVMPSLGNPHRSVPTDSDAPTRGAAEVILDQSNLASIAQETALLSRWEAGRPLLLRAKDRVFSGSLTEHDRFRALLGLLERQMAVQSDENTIKITLAWNDPVIASELVSLAERNFLDGRSAAEVAVIADTIAILEDEGNKGRLAVASAFETFDAISSRLAPAASTSSAAPPRVSSAPRAPVAEPQASPPPSTKASALATELEEKRRAIRAIEEPRQRALAELRAKLADLRLTYAPAHPLVLELQSQISAASAEPKELATLKQEEKALLGRAEAFGSDPGDPYASEPSRPRAPRASPAAPPPSAPASKDCPSQNRDEPPEVVAARMSLQAATRKYEDLVDRTDAARIELATAKAAFKYRYTIVQPPEVPRKPVKPNAPLLVVGGIFLAVVLAVFAAVARDVGGGCFLEPWQLRRKLKVPLLAEVNEP